MNRPPSNWLVLIRAFLGPPRPAPSHPRRALRERRHRDEEQGTGPRSRSEVMVEGRGRLALTTPTELAGHRRHRREGVESSSQRSRPTQWSGSSTKLSHLHFTPGLAAVFLSRLRKFPLPTSKSPGVRGPRSWTARRMRPRCCRASPILRRADDANTRLFWSRGRADRGSDSPRHDTYAVLPHANNATQPAFRDAAVRADSTGERKKLSELL